MDRKPSQDDLLSLSVALGDLRDSLVLTSLALKDHMANTASPTRDEIMLEVERQLAKIKESERKPADLRCTLPTSAPPGDVP